MYSFHVLALVFPHFQEETETVLTKEQVIQILRETDVMLKKKIAKYDELTKRFEQTNLVRWWLAG